MQFSEIVFAMRACCLLSLLWLPALHAGDSSSAAGRVTVWWKPQTPGTIAADVAGLKQQLYATDVILYCGYAAMPDGSFGVDPSPEGNWGSVALCKPAVTAALGAGLGVQIIVEGRMDGNVGAALKLGGSAFGKQALATVQADYPGVSGFNMDWEPGHNKAGNVKPSQAEMDAFTAAFSAELTQPASQPPHSRLVLSACVAPWTPFTANVSRALSVGGLCEAYDMGLYHGLSTSEWAGKLTDAISNAGGSDSGLVVGLSLPPKYAWENTTASVVDRFASIKSSGVRHIALFAWAGGLGHVALPADVLAEWTLQLKAFVVAPAE